MWIELNNKHDDGRPVTQSVKLEDMDEPVSFRDNGKAQVSASVGEYLVETIGSIEPADGDNEDNTDE